MDKDKTKTFVIALGGNSLIMETLRHTRLQSVFTVYPDMETMLSDLTPETGLAS